MADDYAAQWQRCELTELPRYSCSHCRRIPDPPAVTRVVGGWIRARRTGSCIDCGEQYDAGDFIRVVPGEGYTAECCREDL